MRILILANAYSPHTVKWVNGIAQVHDVCLFTLSDPEPGQYKDLDSLEIHSMNLKNKTALGERLLPKMIYILALPKLKKLIKVFKPDLIHAHYATSYGLLGALSGFHPYILSVWGSDVFDFPHGAPWKTKLLKYNLRKANTILSTSNIMAVETRKYTEKSIQITPFGIDPDIFKPLQVKSLFNAEAIVFGTIKRLEEKYGIDYLIRAFAELKYENIDLSLKLLIVGGGSLGKELKALAKELNIEEDILFTGRINYGDVINYYNMLDVYCAISVLDSESFGVAILEASSCELPVIVSDAGGLPDVVENNVTGLIVERRNIEATKRAMEKLIRNPKLRREMGENGRKRVLNKFNWKDNLEQMLDIYKETIEQTGQY